MSLAYVVFKRNVFCFLIILPNPKTNATHKNGTTPRRMLLLWEIIRKSIRLKHPAIQSPPMPARSIAVLRSLSDRCAQMSFAAGDWDGDQSIFILIILDDYIYGFLITH